MNSVRYSVGLLFVIAGLSLWTMGPYGGCSCHNPLGPSTGPSFTPTFTPTAHPTMVDDFEKYNTGTSPTTNYWGGTYGASDDTGETQHIAYTVVADGNSFGSVTKGLHLTGTFNQPAPPPPYSFANLKTYLSPFGDSGRADAHAYGATGLKFGAKKSATSQTILIVKLLVADMVTFTAQHPSSANAYHFHSATVSLSTSWGYYTIPYSTFSWGSSWGTDTGDTNVPTVAASFGGSSMASTSYGLSNYSKVVAIQFEPGPVSSVPASNPYDFTLDDIQFY